MCMRWTSQRYCTALKHLADLKTTQKFILYLMDSCESFKYETYLNNYKSLNLTN